jgi:hypothetical protein
MYHNEMDRKSREKDLKTQFLILPVLMVAFLHDLTSGLGFATGSQIPAHKP